MKTWARSAAFALALATCAAPRITAQQQVQIPSPSQVDPAIPYQISFLIPIDSSSVNQLIGLVNQQKKLGRAKFIILVSSQGGEVLAGLAAYNYLHGMNVDITTYNIGQVDSAANLIFCAGNHRYALPDSRFLIHSAYNYAQPGSALNEQFLDAQSQQVKSMNHLIAQVIETTTGKKAQEVEAAVQGQRILTPTEAVAWNLAQEVKKDFATPGADIADVQIPTAKAPPASTLGSMGVSFVK